MRLIGYKRVHQGGHHDVWCNGKVHTYIYEGGKCHKDINQRDIVNPKYIGVCNCEKFKQR